MFKLLSKNSSSSSSPKPEQHRHIWNHYHQSSLSFSQFPWLQSLFTLITCMSVDFLQSSHYLFLVHCYLLLFPSIIVVMIISCSSLSVYQWPDKSVTLNLFFLFLDVLAVELTPQGNKWTSYPRTSMVLSCTVNRKKETGYYENLKTGKWKLDLLICYQ